MPSGKTHLKIEAGLLFGWTALTGYLMATGTIEPAAVVAFTLAYAVSMLLLSPDLDLARSRAFRRWGPVRWIWIPYALLFRHRRLSHHPIFGPLTRVLYLGGICAIAAAIVVLSMGRPLRIVAPPAEILLAVVLGLYIPNLTHILADRVVSRWRSRRRKRRWL